MKLISLHGRLIGDGTAPLYCISLAGRTRAALLEELSVVLPKKPDVIEWRVDFFEEIWSISAVIDVASCIKDVAGDVPIIFSCRSMKEGGECIALDDADILKLYVAACASRCVDVIDYELSNSSEGLARLRNASRDSNVVMIMSYNNYHFTPDAELLAEKFMEAQKLGADIAKVAVMPKEPEDVLTLLKANAKASKVCDIPLIGMSLGREGALSRMLSWNYGSALTFAMGKNSYAPGQVPIEELRLAVASIRSAVDASGG